ncbi:hypothetical protein EUU00_05790 [Campylobacter upsaliensis]|nr:hypothetical protein [Campylobacter upsaliensis]EAH8309184.1 hypothetical protein [Campylobacter upsaliensis]EAH8539996.1 hypothetical protein [Campylobacter upsaliensis]EAL9760171.1 hypothetical protein [Campylobacter upsaliensis]
MHCFIFLFLPTFNARQSLAKVAKLKLKPPLRKSLVKLLNLLKATRPFLLPQKVPSFATQTYLKLKAPPAQIICLILLLTKSRT